ncbi:MAG: anaerobic sulfatase maturase [Firmicutes bacterium]|nr:anaerobic sulfatase maturase [Bacillota bacterium]
MTASPSVDKGSRKLPFVLMIKPVGSLCNMRCDYCYYLDTDYAGHAPAHLMTDEVLEAVVSKYLEAAAGPQVSFTWHGGEPALAGRDFYSKAIALQQKYLPEGMTCINNLQTNGTLLDEEFCAFLAENHFDVGISIDGTKMIHDAHRRMADGSPTYERVRAAVERLKAHGIRPDLLCTVHSDSVPHAVEIYRALRDLDTGWIQFIPIVNRLGDDSVTPDSVTPEGYGEFLRNVFACWVYHDMGRVNVQLFAETASVLAGGQASLCTLAPTCGNVLVAEYDGSLYACDHFVDQDHLRGYILQDDLRQIVASEVQQAFGLRKKTALPGECRSCPYLKLCCGGCPKDRFTHTASGEAGQTWLCKGLKAYYKDAIPLLNRAIQMSSMHIPADQIMRQLASETRSRYRNVNRNDPCPCGSGLKFKACCAGRLP